MSHREKLFMHWIPKNFNFPLCVIRFFVVNARQREREFPKTQIKNKFQYSQTKNVTSRYRVIVLVIVARIE